MCKLEKYHKCSTSRCPQNTLSQMEKGELGTGSFKQLVENTQENTDVVTCYNVSLLILLYATLSLVLLSKVDGQLINSRADVKLGRVESMLYDRLQI